MPKCEIVSSFRRPYKYYVLDLLKTPPEVMGDFSSSDAAQKFIVMTTCSHNPEWGTLRIKLVKEDWDNAPIQVKCRKCGYWGNVGSANIVRPPTWPAAQSLTAHNPKP